MVAFKDAGADRIEVPTARIGLIIPSVNRLSEAQFMRFAPTGLAIHVTRARIAGKWRRPVTELAPIIAAAAGALSDASPDLIVYHCTDSSMREGLAFSTSCGGRPGSKPSPPAPWWSRL
jgi:maleate cis-trans isomerase